MVRTRPGISLAIASLVLVWATSVLGGDILGTFTLAGGYLENPLGIAREQAAGFTSQTLSLATLRHRDADSFKLGYELEASQFGNGTELGSWRHGLGWEWLRTAPDGLGATGLGLQYSLRDYQSAYEYYDHHQLDFYTVWKTYPRPDMMFRAVGTFRYRRYADLPEESYYEPRMRLEGKRFFANRTTIGLALDLGLKKFYDSAASRVWETPHLPSTSQLAARLNIARGLGDRVGLRGWVEQRVSLEGFPHYVGEDVYDSPLLDFYAHEGTDALAAVKWLSPMLFWVEAGVAYGDHDYGDLLFVTDDGGAPRQDTVRDYFVSLTRSLGIGDRPASLKIRGGLRDQDSTLASYTYTGAFFSSSLAYSF